jgi:hypothetical protein
VGGFKKENVPLLHFPNNGALKYQDTIHRLLPIILLLNSFCSPHIPFLWGGGKMELYSDDALANCLTSLNFLLACNTIHMYFLDWNVITLFLRSLQLVRIF